MRRVTVSAVPSVTVVPLGTASPDPIGLLPQSLTGFPRTLWSGSEVDALSRLIAEARVDSLPVMRDLLRTLLLAEAEAPRLAGPDGALFLARVDKLLDMGALDPAWEMLRTADPETPPLFRRYLDVGLLMGRETAACRLMADKPELAPALAARVFCLSQLGDYPGATLTLNTARALGDVTPRQDAIMTRFLDPELFETLPPLPLPERPTPLEFRMREAIGEGLSTVDLPRAFAHADLRTVNGWKVRLDAAERLVRVGAISDQTLLGLYTLREPAASGGVWERAVAVQDFEAALGGGDPAAIGAALVSAWDQMRAAGLETAFARLFADRLNDVDLDGEADRIGFHILLLGGNYQAAAEGRAAASPSEAVLIAISKGETLAAPAGEPVAEALLAAFGDTEPAADLLDLVAQDRTGEAILMAMARFDEGVGGDTAALTQSLAFFRTIGLEDVARRAALQLLILEAGE